MEKLEPMYLYQGDARQTERHGIRQLVDCPLVNNLQPLEFDITKGEPALPLQEAGNIYHNGWDIPTRYAVDAQRQAWMDNAHGHALHRVSMSDLLITFETPKERLALETKLGLTPSAHPCPACGQLVSGQAKTREWTTDALIKAVTSGTQEEKLDLLKKIGILTPDGNLAEKYKSWGNKPSRTPEME